MKYVFIVVEHVLVHSVKALFIEGRVSSLDAVYGFLLLYGNICSSLSHSLTNKMSISSLLIYLGSFRLSSARF